jgi:hypothetical protein
VQVPCDEGVAIHIRPESCAVAREGLGEALTGVRVGQPLSRESFSLPHAEGNMNEGISASPRSDRRCKRPWRAQILLAREPGSQLLLDRRRRRWPLQRRKNHLVDEFCKLLSLLTSTR